MKKTIAFITTVVVLFGISLALGQMTKPESKKLTLKVTSSSNEQISFMASIFFGTKDSKIQIVKQEVPYEISVESNYVNATFVRTSGKADLVVELFVPKTREDATDLGATGSAIVVGTLDAEKGLYYQHPF